MRLANILCTYHASVRMKVKVVDNLSEQSGKRTMMGLKKTDQPYGMKNSGAYNSMNYKCGMAAEFEYTPYTKSSLMP